MARLSVLAIAAATGRIGYVYFVGHQLRDWGLSAAASKDPNRAAAQTSKWLDLFNPDVVVTERTDRSSRKGAATRRLIETISGVASDVVVNDIRVPRIQRYQNKYEEAEGLVQRFPEIQPWKPKRPRLWESEPRNMIYFEAIALALEIIDGGRRQRT
jgi:hypothetical protein